MSERGAALLEAKTGEKVKNPALNHLFLANYQAAHVITCSIANLNDQSKDEWQMYNDNYAKAYEKLLNLRYNEFARVSIQAEKDLRQKGELIFDIYSLTVSTPTRLLRKICFYNGIHKNFGVNITMAFSDEKIGEEMLEILRKSTFE